LKKFYLFIAKSYLRAFLPTFGIVMGILLMQVIWLYVDELVGKGLEWQVIAELLFYFSASIIPQALPLSVLLASIMTFGNLGESYELVAAKAAGISIWKMFRPMFAIMIIIAIFGFFVANVLIPMANLKRGALLFDVRQKKPSLAIKPGVFSQDIPGITLRVGGKNNQTQELYDIIIYDQRDNQSYSTIITAKSGNISMSNDKRYMFLSLFNGYRYEEMEKTRGYYISFPHTATSFAEEKITFDLNSFKFSRTDENLFKQHWEMLNVIQLSQSADSLIKLAKYKHSQLRNIIKPNYFFTRLSWLDSIGFDTLNLPQPEGLKPDLINNFEPNIKATILNDALTLARNGKSTIDYSTNEITELNKLIIRHTIEWHRKFILSIACIVMFFIGAPLGSIIRKGGFGVPIVVSVILYIGYHILSLSGEKAAKTFAWSPLEGMWIGIFIFIPLGFFFTYQASNDSKLFDKTLYTNTVKSILSIVKKKEKLT